MSSHDYVIILFNGFASSKLWWRYAFEGKPTLRKIDFLKNLQKIGQCYTFNQPFMNLNYYGTPDNKKEKALWDSIYKRYKPTSSNISFKLEDLEYKNICEKVYNDVKRKYGNSKKYIVIGHSYGGPIALLFAKLFKRECVLCCCIDNAPYTLSFYRKFDDREHKDILKKYTNNVALKKSLSIIRTSKDPKIRNAEIHDVFTFIAYRSCQDRIKYYDNKLHTPTVFFKAYHPDSKKEGDIMRDKYNCIEKRTFNGDKNLKAYVMFKDAEHYIWKKQEFSDTMIDTIKNVLLDGQ